MAKTLKAGKKEILELLICLNKFPGDKVGADFDKLINARRAVKKPIRAYLDKELDLQDAAQKKAQKIHKEQIAPLQKKIEDLQKIPNLTPEQKTEISTLSTQMHAYESETRHIVSDMQIAMSESQESLGKTKGEIVFDHEDFLFVEKMIKENGEVIFAQEASRGGPATTDYDLAERMYDLLSTVE